jgi:hypothetical protein
MVFNRLAINVGADPMPPRGDNNHHRNNDGVVGVGLRGGRREDGGCKGAPIIKDNDAMRVTKGGGLGGGKRIAATAA